LHSVSCNSKGDDDDEDDDYLTYLQKTRFLTVSLWYN